ncbi:MAG: hypothetical protein ACYTCU_00435 [Planctomycetota bacterium]|jgi:hypothetical protein
MDRQTLAQAVAMLVVLAALLRWLPSGDAKDALGRGDPWRTIEADATLARGTLSADSKRALMLGTWMPQGYSQRYHQVFKLLRELERESEPDAVVDLREFARNERWMLTYLLYPRRVAARGDELGPPLDSASWVLHSGGPTGRPSLLPVYGADGMPR